jgi:hypothetical protein
MDIADMMNVVDAESAARVFQELLIEERALENEIQVLLRDSEVMDDKMKQLRQRMPDASILRQDAADLMKAITFTSTLATSVSSKIKKMDLVEKRVNDCLSRVSDIVDLKTCTEGIQSALDNEEYENAALIVQRFLKIDEDEIRRSSLSKSSLDEAFTKLHDAKKKLQNMVLRKFDEAVKLDDVASVERFFKLFPFLNQEEEGLRKFSNYLSTKIHDGSPAANTKTTSDSAPAPLTHSEQLGNLFQVVAKIIDVHQPLVETYYKHGNLLLVIQVLQKECDVRAKKILNDFMNKRELKATLNLISKSLKQNQSTSWSSSGNAGVKIEPRELDALLSEIIFVNSRSETYLKFIRRRVEEDFAVAFPDVQSEERIRSAAAMEKFVRNSDLFLLMQEISGHYVLMEEYFLRESMMKAIELDGEHDPEANTISCNMLDDVFFIVKKCIRRACSSGNMDVLCAVINHTIALLDTTFADALNDRIRYGFPNSIATLAASLDLSQAYNALQSGRYLQSSSDLEKTKKLFLTGVNNLDLATECIATLKQQVRDEVARSAILSSGQIRENGKLDSALLDLSSLTTKFQSLSRQGVQQIYLSLLKPRIKIWAEALIDAENELTEQELQSLETSEGLRPFTSGFLFDVDQALKVLKPQLTSRNYNNLIVVLAEEFCKRAEAAILKSAFNKVRTGCNTRVGFT